MTQKREPTLRIHYRDEQGWEGLLVIDSLVGGLAAGGCRVSRTVDEKEVRRLGRAMTLKNAALGLQLGGAKCGIRYDPRSTTRLDALTRFFEHIKPFCESMYGFGPDMNVTTAESDDIARRIGMPSRMWALARSAPDPHGLLERYHAALQLRSGPLTVAEARTGAGVAGAVQRAAAVLGLGTPIRVALQGFGAVGSGTAWCLAREGHKLVAVADEGACLSDPAGLDVAALIETRRASAGRLEPGKLPGVRASPPEAILSAECDVLVLAAIGDVLNGGNAGAVKARVVVEGANLAVDREATVRLHARDVPVVPDFVASGGAMTATYGLLRLGFPHDHPDRLLERIRDHIGDATERALMAGRELRVPVRQAVLPAAGEVEL